MGTTCRSMLHSSFAPTTDTPWGPAIDFRQPAGAPFLHRERVLLVDGVPFRRAALRCGPCNQEPDWVGRDGCDGTRNHEPGRHVHLVLETSQCLELHLREGISMRSGTMTATMCSMSCSTGEDAMATTPIMADRPVDAARPMPGRRLRLSGRAIALSRRRAARHAERRSAADSLRAVPAEP